MSDQHTQGIPDPGLLEFCTERQREVLEAVLEHGSSVKAAEALGVSSSTVRDSLYNLRRKAARVGYCPESDNTRPVPPGFHLRGTSTLYNGEGAVTQQWVKTEIDREHRAQALLDAMHGLLEPMTGKSVFVEPPAHCDDDLLCVYPMGDPHLGMYSWAQETGHDFDLEIAERNLFTAVDHLVEVAPAAKRALFIDLGDFFHADTKDNRTLGGGNALDVDTRWSKVLRTGIRTKKRLIDRALEKHEQVDVIVEIGNHDEHSAAMLALCLAEFYANNPRVRIDQSPDSFHWCRFGKNLIGVTHGHRVKAHMLPGIMAYDRKEDWGETDPNCRFWYTGHVHHDTKKDYVGCSVETFRTLAPGDAWHHHQGYRSQQDMKCDVLHREYGRVNRHIIGIRQIWAREAATQ